MSQNVSPAVGPGGVDFSAAASGAPPQAATQPGAQIATTQIAPPGAAVSPYEYQIYVAGAQVTLGPQIAQILGLPADTPQSGDKVLQAYYELNSTELTTLNSLLAAGGYYQSAAGTPVTSGFNLGVFNNDNFDAFSAAILQAANAKQPMSTMLSQQIASGAGFLQQKGATAPIIGGGNTYQVDLTNPEDIYQQAYSTFEQALGRAPDADELKALTATLHSEETRYQQARNTQAESMSQARYAQQVNSRTAMQTPQAANGPISNGPFRTPADAAVAVLEAARFPVTTSSVSLVASWITANGGLNPETHNLLGTTTGQTNQSGQTTYSNWAAGIQAAVNMLASPQFANLRAVLSSGDAAGQFASGPLADQAKKELSAWSGGRVTNLDPSGETDAANQAVSQYQTNQQITPGLTVPAGTTVQGLESRPGAPDLTRSQAPNFMGPLPGGGITPGLTVPAGTTVAGLNSGGPQLPNQMGPAQIGGGQGIPSPGDSYLPSNTLTDTQAPSAAGAAFTEATTGANAVPYLANQYLQAYQAILSMIKAGGPTQ